jgi:hypothetical protein
VDGSTTSRANVEFVFPCCRSKFTSCMSPRFACATPPASEANDELVKNAGVWTNRP